MERVEEKFENKIDTVKEQLDTKVDEKFDEIKE